MKKFIFVLLSVLCFSVLSTASMAQRIKPYLDESKQEVYAKPMPETVALDADKLNAETTLYTKTPFGDKSLGYSIRVPNGWNENNEETEEGDQRTFNNRIFGDIGVFSGPVSKKSGFPSRLTVKALELTYEQTAQQWFMQYLVSNGYSLQGMTVHDRNRVEALYIVLEGDTSFVVRAMAVRNANRIMWAQYFMPMDLWVADKPMQASVIGSFTKLQDKRQVIERMKTYQFLDIAQFEYPESWRLKTTPIRSMDRMEASVQNVSRWSDDIDENKVILDGLVNISLTSIYESPSLSKVIDDYKANVSSQGLSLKNEIAFDDPVSFHPIFVDTDIVVYKALDLNKQLLDYEYWMASMSFGEYHYIATLLTPAREQDLATWTRNTESFKIIVETILPQEDSYAIQ